MSSIEETAEELSEEMADLDTEEKPVTKKKSSAKKKAAAKTTNGHAAPKKTSAKKTSKKSPDKENQVSLKSLCKELKLDPRVGRRRLRAADLKPEGRWTWEEGSSALKKAKDVLATPAE